MHDKIETPNLHKAEPRGENGQVETPDPHTTTPNGKNNQVKTPYKQIREELAELRKTLAEIDEVRQQILHSDRIKQESKKYEAVLKIQCKVRQIQAAMKYLDARTEKRSMSEASIQVMRGQKSGVCPKHLFKSMRGVFPMIFVYGGNSVNQIPCPKYRYLFTVWIDVRS